MSILMLETKKYAVKIDNFEGPLDLLCHLIDKNKMNIYDIFLIIAHPPCQIPGKRP